MLNNLTTGFVARPGPGYRRLVRTGDVRPGSGGPTCQVGRGRIGNRRSATCLRRLWRRFGLHRPLRPRKGARFNMAPGHREAHAGRRNGPAWPSNGARATEDLAGRGLDERAAGTSPDGEYEAQSSHAVTKPSAWWSEAEFSDFAVFQCDVSTDSREEVAESLGVSELDRQPAFGEGRGLLVPVGRVIYTYSFTQDEIGEAERNGLTLNPTNAEDALFDETSPRSTARRWKIAEESKTHVPLTDSDTSRNGGIRWAFH